MNKQILYDSGYRRGSPTAGLVDAASIDHRICVEATCEQCGHSGMDYQPFIRDEPHSYRAFAVCPECKEAFEF